MTDGTTTPPTDAERLDAIVAYQGSFREVEKLALETLARTARDPLFCFELAIAMQDMRHKIVDLRGKRGKQT